MFVHPPVVRNNFTGIYNRMQVNPKMKHADLIVTEYIFMRPRKISSRYFLAEKFKCKNKLCNVLLQLIKKQKTITDK